MNRGSNIKDILLGYIIIIIIEIIILIDSLILRIYNKILFYLYLINIYRL